MEDIVDTEKLILKKLPEKIGEIKLLIFIYDTYFFYDINNILKSTDIGEIEDNEVDLIRPKKLDLIFKKDI